MMKKKALPVIIAALMLSGCAEKKPIPEPPAPTETAFSEVQTEATEKTDVIETEPKPEAPKTETVTESPEDILPESGLIQVPIAYWYKVRCKEDTNLDKDVTIKSEADTESFIEAISDIYEEGEERDKLFSYLRHHDDIYLSGSLLYISARKPADNYEYFFENAIYSKEKDRAVITWHESPLKDDEPVPDARFVLITNIDRSRIGENTDMMLEMTFDDNAPAIISETAELKGNVYTPTFDKGSFRTALSPHMQDMADAALREVQDTYECRKISEAIRSDSSKKSLWKDYDEEENVIPEFSGYLSRDFDGDGYEEYFLLYALPSEEKGKYYQLVFVSSDGVVRIPDNGYGNGGKLSVIDYGGFSHLLLSFEDTAQIYSVSEGTVRNIYSGNIDTDSTCGSALFCTSPPAPDKRLCIYNEDMERYAEIAAGKISPELAEALFESEAFKSEKLTKDISSAEEIEEKFFLIGGKYISGTEPRCTFIMKDGGFERSAEMIESGYPQYHTLCTADLTAYE